MTKMMTNKEILEKLGGRNCGLCGMKTCEGCVEIVLKNPDAINRCPFVKSNSCATCTVSSVCIEHFGVLRPSEKDVFYGGE